MVMAGIRRPLEARKLSIFFTVPEMEAWTGEETKPSASAMRCPIFTYSPTFTSGRAGVPMCMDMGMVTDFGQSMMTAGRSAVFLWCGTWTPCILSCNQKFISCSPSFLR